VLGVPLLPFFLFPPRRPALSRHPGSAVSLKMASSSRESAHRHQTGVRDDAAWQLGRAVADHKLSLGLGRCKHDDDDDRAKDHECLLYVGSDDVGNYQHICADCNYGDVQPFAQNYRCASEVVAKARVHAEKFHALLRNRDEHGIAMPYNTSKRGFPNLGRIRFRAGKVPQPPSRQTAQSMQPTTQPQWRAATPPPLPPSRLDVELLALLAQPPQSMQPPSRPSMSQSQPTTQPPSRPDWDQLLAQPPQSMQPPSRPSMSQSQPTTQPPSRPDWDQLLAQPPQSMQSSTSRPLTPLPEWAPTQPPQAPTQPPTRTPKTTTRAPPAPTQPPQTTSAPPLLNPRSLSRPPSRPPVVIDVSGADDEQCLSLRRDDGRPQMGSGEDRERDDSSRVTAEDLELYLQEHRAQGRQELWELMQQFLQQQQQQFQQQQQDAEGITATVLAAADSATAAAASASAAAASAGIFAAAATSATAASAQLSGADTIGRALHLVGGQLQVAPGKRPTALIFAGSGWPTDFFRRLQRTLGHMAKERLPGEEPSLDWQGWKLAGYPDDGTPFIANALRRLSLSSPGFTEAFQSQFEGPGAPPLTIHGLAAPGTDSGYNHRAQVDKLIAKMRAILATGPNTQLIVVGYAATASPVLGLSHVSDLSLSLSHQNAHLQVGGAAKQAPLLPGPSRSRRRHHRLALHYPRRTSPWASSRRHVRADPLRSHRPGRVCSRRTRHVHPRV
jgi:hypothetical protein